MFFCRTAKIRSKNLRLAVRIFVFLTVMYPFTIWNVLFIPILYIVPKIPTIYNVIYANGVQTTVLTRRNVIFRNISMSSAPMESLYFMNAKKILRRRAKNQTVSMYWKRIVHPVMGATIEKYANIPTFTPNAAIYANLIPICQEKSPKDITPARAVYLVEMSPNIRKKSMPVKDFIPVQTVTNTARRHVGMVRRHGMRNVVRIIAVWMPVLWERNVYMRPVPANIVMSDVWSVMRDFVQLRLWTVRYQVIHRARVAARKYNVHTMIQNIGVCSEEGD